MEQILGRVLRMPHVQQHGHDLLNLSYVFTASNRFMDTLQSVVKGLNRAGFSDKDYRAIDAQATDAAAQGGTAGAAQRPLDGLFDPAVLEAETESTDELDVSAVPPDWEAAATAATDAPSDADANETGSTRPDLASPGAAFVADIKARALAENQAFEERAQASHDSVAPELEDKMNRHKVKDLSLIHI